MYGARGITLLAGPIKKYDDFCTKAITFPYSLPPKNAKIRKVFLPITFTTVAHRGILRAHATNKSYPPTHFFYLKKCYFELLFVAVIHFK